MLTYTFRTIAALLGLYNALCIIRILLTWIPQLAYSRVTQILSRICDPFLNLFRGIKFLRLGSIDFSPAIALCILSALQSVFAGLSNNMGFSIGTLLSLLVQIFFSVIQSFIVFLIIFFVIRIVIISINNGSWHTNSYLIESVDRTISPVVFKIAKTFSFGRNITYKTALIISTVVLILLLIALSFISYYLSAILASLPL